MLYDIVLYSIWTILHTIKWLVSCEYIQHNNNLDTYIWVVWVRYGFKNRYQKKEVW